MEIKMEEFNLLESLQDLIGQLQMGKCSEEEVLEVLNNIVSYTRPNIQDKTKDILWDFIPEKDIPKVQELIIAIN